MGPAERARIDAELEAARAGNVRLEERMRAYEAGPTLVNEIHSVLGSEFDGLSPALEAHYAQFFTSRAAILAARQRTLGVLEDRMDQLRVEIDDLDAAPRGHAGLPADQQPDPRLQRGGGPSTTPPSTRSTPPSTEYNARLGGG